MAFSSKYQAQIDDLYNQLANRNFSYDYTTDPLYAQYASQYTKNGQKAMEDTYGMVAARTGGLGSSYANVAAQNAYGNYMSELAAKIPELEQIARSNFDNDTSRMNGTLSSLLNMRDQEYNQYVQEYNWYLQQQQLAAQQAAAAAKQASTQKAASTPAVTPVTQTAAQQAIKSDPFIGKNTNKTNVLTNKTTSPIYNKQLMSVLSPSSYNTSQKIRTNYITKSK